MTDPDEWESNYYDGPLELRPFLRAWWRERAKALRWWLKYRVLRRPLPAPPPPARPSLALATAAEMYKRAYALGDAEKLASHPGLFELLAKLKRKDPP